MKRVLGVVAVLFLLVGCGSKETTTVCKGNIDGVKVENQISAKGDKVIKTKETGTLDFTTLNPTEDEMKEMAELIGDEYKELKGVTYNYELKEKVLAFNVEIDYEKADLKQLEEKKLIQVGEEGTPEYIGLKMTKETLEKQGLSCNEK